MTVKNDHIEDLIPDYLDGELLGTAKADVEAHLKSCQQCTKELEAYKKLLDAVAQDTLEMPTKNVREGFEKMLKNEQDNQVRVVNIGTQTNKRWWQNIPRVAASIALLIASYFVGKYSEQGQAQSQIVSLQNEAMEYKEVALISLLENESASKRMQGVQLVQDFEKPDEQIVGAIGQKMLNDENTNVRLSALEALSSFSYSEQVKDLFVKALETEKNPSVQVAIIEVLVELQEKKAIAPMKKLLEEEETQPFIKDQINSAIPKII